ncbi:MAG: hypothetical protein MUF42_12575 [Cytophagaceae bacterium]|jgi:hypothetical protein|nr:hypothetical protein [Cytophagaceae bacterium]
MKTIVLMLLAFFSIQTLSAAPPDKAKTKAYLMKTTRALGVAHMTVKRTKNYDGTLAKAIRHQRVARKMYQAGNLGRALAHSRRARTLARDIMKNNKAKPNPDFDFTKDEQALVTDTATDSELETEMTTQEPAAVKDEDLMNGSLDIDVK